MIRSTYTSSRILRLYGRSVDAAVNNKKLVAQYKLIVRHHRVVMVRHGESLWNKENRFTGWCDVPLTEKGEYDAKDAGLVIKEKGIKFDVAFTSQLERAWRTCAITLNACDSTSVETIRTSSLNERHYGGEL